MESLQKHNISWIKIYIALPTQSLTNDIVYLYLLSLKSGEQNKENLNPHPFHKVPTIEYKLNNNNNPTILFESNAILMFLTELFDTKRLISPTIETTGLEKYGERLKWMHWTNNTFENLSPLPIRYLKSFIPKYSVPINEIISKLDNEELQHLNDLLKPFTEELLPFIEKELSTKATNYLLSNNNFDVCDICLGFCLLASKFLGLLGENTKFTKTKEYATRLFQRPSFVETFKIINKYQNH
ncbi:hypothetical protein ABK040_003375 [Willaertia magna]